MDSTCGECAATLPATCAASQSVLAVEKLESHGCGVRWATEGDLGAVRAGNVLARFAENVGLRKVCSPWKSWNRMVAWFGGPPGVICEQLMVNA